MIKVTPETQLDGLAQKLKELSSQLVAILDTCENLEICAMWCDDEHPNWGGASPKVELIRSAENLRRIYMDLAAITGLDPSWQFEETKQKRRLMARSVADIEMPDFQDD